MSAPLLEVADLHVSAATGRTIVAGVDLSLAAGETLAIVGESGSGKSVTARALLGLLPPGFAARGSVRYEGRELLGMSDADLRAVRGAGISMVLQDPFTMLNPLVPVGRQLTERLRGAHGRRLGRAARRAEAVRRLAEVGIADPSVAGRYPFQLSGGMRQRVGIAAALAGDPRLLVADEPTTALDVTTQAEILRLLRSLQESRGMGIVLITHDLRVAFSVATRVLVLYAGSLLERADAEAIEAQPLHPYTHGLLLSEPPRHRRVARLAAIPGSVPVPDEVAGMCPFATRCAFVQDVCTVARPPLRELAPGHATRCVRAEELLDALVVGAGGDPRGAPPPSLAGAAAEEPVLRVGDLRKEFAVNDGGARTRTVLDGVSLTVAPGQSVGVVGESGCGKTTLARCIVGLEQATAGRLVVDGVEVQDPRALDAAARARVRGAVQMVFQDPYSSLNPVMTIGTTLRESLRLRDATRRELDRRAAELLERVGLPAAYAGRKPVALSGGERQRVAIARALALEPRLVICDEPVSALDVSVQAQIINLLNELREALGLSYLFISHDLHVVRQMAEHVVVLYRGRIVEEGPVDAVLDDPQHEYTRALVRSIPGNAITKEPR
jgi:peptide/nickel transport system ATP-binding protein